MSKQLLVLCMVCCFLITMVVVAPAIDKKIKSQTNPTIISSNSKPVKISPFIEQVNVMQPEVIYSTDFEKEGEWQPIQLGSTGHIFKWVTDKYHSATHSWHAPDDSATTEANAIPIETAIVSPEIKLPAELGGSAVKILEMSYWFNVQTPNTVQSGGVYDVWQPEIFVPYEGANFWHIDEYEAFEGKSWWCGDPSLHTYGPNWRQELWTPVLDLSGATGKVVLTFKNAPNSEPGYDFCFVEISSDGGKNWDRLARYDEEHDPVQYFDVNLDITTYKTSSVIVRWRFESDGGTESVHSWHIDNIKISDDVTTHLFDDGGDTASKLIAKENPLCWNRLHYDYADEASGHNPPGWKLEDKTTIYNGTLDLLKWAGQTVRFRIRVSTDGWNRLGANSGYGFYFDDLEIIGMGIAPYDVAVVGTTGFQNAVVEKKLNLGVVVTSIGSNNITGTIQWTGEILAIDGVDTTLVWPAMFGKLDVKDFARDSVVVIPTFQAREWPVNKPGDYLFRGKVSYAQDGDLTNNTFSSDFIVYGPPKTNVVYRENFEDAEKITLEDFGFTVVNEGGCKATGLNVNKWENIPFNFGNGSALISAFWGILDPGTDVVAPYDSSEVLKEALITPEIDISHLGKHATLFMNYFVYFRSGYTNYAIFGAQKSDFSVDFSIDGGKTWNQVFFWSDYDGLTGNGPRLPNHYYGMDKPIGTFSYLGVDLTKAILMGGKSLRIRFRLNSENSYFVGLDIDDIVVYSGVDYARITNVVDVPQDQGKQVRVSWQAAFNDMKIWATGEDGMYGQFEQHFVTHYNLWRQIPAGNYGVTVSDLKSMLTRPGKPGDSFILGDAQFDFIATIPAHHDAAYNYVAPTLWDGVETFFMVSAHTNDPLIFVDSKLMSGKSVDNLAPSAPMNLMAVGQNNTNILTWEGSPEPDVKYYSIYRGESSGSYPAQPQAYTAELTYTDVNVVIGKTYFYVVTATDFGLNEGKRSNEASVLTSVGDHNSNAIPKEFALDQNYPNPFNPTTHINYQLPTNAHVTIVIVNSKGQEIRTLVNSNMNAGYHTAIWDGTNNSGEKVTSGLYLYKIKAGSFNDMKKMMLIR